MSFNRIRQAAFVALCAAASISSRALAAPDPGEAQDSGWPRIFTKEGREVVIHQPQIDSWVDYQVLQARAAVAVKSAPSAEPLYGILKLKAQTRVDRDTRTVLLHEPEVAVKFPNADASKASAAEAIMREVAPNRRSMTISLDRALAFVDRDAAAQKGVEVNLDPPPIFHSAKPAILVIFIGPPEFQPIAGTGLMAAVNTNWDLLLDSKTTQYFLLNEGAWLVAPDPLKGPWVAAKTPPNDLAKLPADENWNEVRAAAKSAPAKQAPAVLASQEPAELIVTDGPPKYTPISGTSLMAVGNTESRLFFLPAEGTHYFLVAGRWFKAKDLAGPWSAATLSLPADFAKIPEDSPYGDIRANVPNTEEASDAILLASTPELASVKKDATIEVAYDGEPRFKPIASTGVSYAVNTAQQVFLVGGKYYCCQQGVWFVAPAQGGPWTVCAAVPDPIYTIPASHPAHNVTYVHVYEDEKDEDDDEVTVGYTSGYRGQYVAGGLLMFGAGYAFGREADDDDDDWEDDLHYHYGPHWYSYGCAAHYDIHQGGYLRTAHYYGPYGGAGRGASYNPRTGTWRRGSYVYGPQGTAWARQAYNPRTDVYRAQAGGSNVYGSWSQGYVSRGDEWARGGRVATEEGKAGWMRTSQGGGAVGVKGEEGRGAGAVKTGQGDGAVGAKGQNAGMIKTSEGEFYVGGDDNIYKRDDEGNWYKNDSGSWSEVSREQANQSMAAKKEARPATAAPTDAEARAPRPSDRTTSSAKRPTPAASATRTAPAQRDKTWASREPSDDFRAQLERQASARQQGTRSSERYERSSSSSRTRSGSGGGSRQSSRGGGGARGGGRR